MADYLLEHRADVGRADEGRTGVRERLSAPRRQLFVAAHRVLELGAVRLDRVRRAGSRRHGPPEEDMVGKDEVGGKLGANSGGVRLDVATAFLSRQILEQTRLEPLVAVEHEDR